ncbi:MULTISPECIES: hypothetical protein [Bacillus]|uniref:hypothetical protein n=1 Tax=Bacillus TaxID=1386 RepID=UPI00273EE75C|nr:hypothetical protein [Bacillus sp. MMSF_3328]
MHSALLPDGKVVTANEFAPQNHAAIFCIDCRAPVIFVAPTEQTRPHFKTSGKGDSVHKNTCGFFQKLSFEDAVAKVTEYQSILKGSGIEEIVIRINLNSIDPDYEARVIEREEKEEKKEKKVKVKNETETPQSITTLKAVKKLFLGHDPDVLASIQISIKGNKVPISYLIRDHNNAHRALWTGELNQNLPYFVHGTVEKVIRRDKVIYINFSTKDSYFSLVIFQKYFKHFTYKDKDLVGREILAFGSLRKNKYSADRQSTEMYIKSNKYIEFLPR